MGIPRVGVCRRIDLSSNPSSCEEAIQTLSRPSDGGRVLLLLALAWLLVCAWSGVCEWNRLVAESRVDGLVAEAGTR
jgi:hypothetical protein